MAGLLDWVDPAREWWRSRPDAIRGLLSGAYSLATDPAAREAAMARQPAPFDKSATGQQMFDSAMNVGPQGLLGKIVYHGSPHKFDKFDASKIGTGEGAQAYGHGVYLADAPEVGSGYARGLGKAEIDGAPIRFDDPMQVAAHEVHLQGGDIAKAADRLYRAAQHRTHSAPPSIAKKASEILDGLIENKSLSKAQKINSLPKVEQGSLYKADLPDEWIPKMLDWDSPISEAQRVPLSKAMMEKFGSGASQSNGEQILKSLAWEFKNAGSKNPQADAANFMREAGIPGIRYLDGGSRGNGSILKQFATKKEAEAFASSAGGTTVVQPRPNGWVVVGEPSKSYNYVVFPGLEDQVKILERNGIPLSGLLGR